MKTTEKKFEQAMHECYCKLFERSTPQGDFEKMLAEAETNEFGQKVIPFMDYEIDEEELEAIVKESFEKYKLNKMHFGGFRTSILLGCSPKSKVKN